MHTTVIWITLDVERANVFDVKVAKYVSLSIVRMYVRKYDTCHYPCQKFLQSKQPTTQAALSIVCVCLCKLNATICTPKGCISVWIVSDFFSLPNKACHNGTTVKLGIKELFGHPKIVP